MFNAYFAMKIFAFFAAAILLLSACTETKFADPAKAILSPDEPEMIFKDINTMYSENTRSMIRMQAKVQLRYPGGNERYPEGINITLYRETGEMKSTLVADSARYDANTKIYTVMGNVVVQNLIEKKKLESDLLNWSKDSEEVYTDHFVKITADGQILTGKGLKATQDFSDYEILEPSGVVSLNDN